MPEKHAALNLILLFILLSYIFWFFCFFFLNKGSYHANYRNKEVNLVAVCILGKEKNY